MTRNPYEFEVPVTKLPAQVRYSTRLLGSLPALFIFNFFQRYFIRGLTLGAVKG